MRACSRRYRQDAPRRCTLAKRDLQGALLEAQRRRLWSLAAGHSATPSWLGRGAQKLIAQVPAGTDAPRLFGLTIEALELPQLNRDKPEESPKSIGITFDPICACPGPVKTPSRAGIGAVE